MSAKPLLILPLVVALAACGGGTATTSSTDGTVSVVITDNLTQSYSEVWVSVQSISTFDANGQAVSLYQDATGQAHNLSQLVDIGVLVDTQQIPAGTYTDFEVVLANEIRLVDAAGNVTTASFDQSGNPTYTTTVTGRLVVDANQNSSLALDFDLARFTYDAATNTVNPVVVQKDPGALNQTVATTTGQVSAIDAPDQFVLTPANGGPDVSVQLHANATVTDPASGSVGVDTSALGLGQTVTVSGVYDADTLSILASDVQVEAAPAGGAPVTVRDEVEGIVTAFDGANLTLDVKEASFVPGGNEITLNVANAMFSRGGLDMLAVGQEVEIKGAWDGNAFTAALVEVEGAPRNAGSDHGHADDYAEVEGVIAGLSDGVITLTVAEFDDVDGVSLGVGDTLDIDSADSWLKDGDASCLVAGARVEVKGAFDASGGMTATVIEIDSGCGASGDDDGTREDDMDGESDDD